MDGCNLLKDSCSTTTHPCLVSAIDSEDSCSTSTIVHPCSVSLPWSSMNPVDLYERYSNVSSIVSSKEIDIFNEDTDWWRNGRDSRNDSWALPVWACGGDQYGPIWLIIRMYHHQMRNYLRYCLRIWAGRIPVTLVLLVKLNYCRCHCGNYKMITSREECICCCSIKVVSKMEKTGTSCTTESEGFDAGCLNQWVLQTAYYQYISVQATVWEVFWIRIYTWVCLKWHVLSVQFLV